MFENPSPSPNILKLLIEYTPEGLTKYVDQINEIMKKAKEMSKK